jgi:hypothetical protein
VAEGVGPEIKLKYCKNSNNKNGIGILMGVALNLWIAFSNTTVFTLFCLSVNMGGLSIFWCLLHFPSSVFYSFHCKSLSLLGT